MVRVRVRIRVSVRVRDEVRADSVKTTGQIRQGPFLECRKI